ncbi:MAG: hypothetical protein KBT27_14830 [Prevotellaceae bacterium]|nr:hypothetical protein [Candidatus Faecinaster equi]
MKTKFKFLATMLIGVLLSVNVWGEEPETIYYETFGTASSSTDWSNASSYFSDPNTSSYGSSTNWRISKSSSNTCTIEGSSRNSHLFFQQSGSNPVFVLTFGDLSGYTDVTLTLNWKNGASTSGNRTLTIKPSANGGATWGSDLIGSNRSVEWQTLTYNVPVASLKNFAIEITNTGNNDSHVDDIKLVGTPAQTCTPAGTALAVSASPTSITTSETSTLSITGGNEGAVTYSVTSSNASSAHIDGTTFSATAIGTYTVRAHQDMNGEVCEQNATVDIVVTPERHEVRWHVGGEITTVRVAEGDPVVFPANPETPISCGTKVFTGWTNDPYENVSVPPTYYKSATMETSDLDFYAVFADASGDPANFIQGNASSLTDGQIVVIHDNAGRALTTDGYTGSKIPGTDITPSNNKIPTTSITEGMKWTVGVVGDKYTFRQGSNYLMVGSFYLEFGTTQTQWELENADGGYYFKNSGSYPYIGYSSYGYAYDIFTTNTYAAILNVFIPNVSYANYVTSCATYNVTWKVNNAVYEAGGSTTAPGGGKVSALPTAPTPTGGCAGSVFVGWTDHEVLDGEAPTPLFKTVADAPVVTGDVTYHAVFADENE